VSRSRILNSPPARPACGGRGRLIILSSPSGAGKTTVYKKLLAQIKGLKYSVSFTTRPKRRGEKNGRDYLFVTIPEFRRMVHRRELLEWELVYGHYYGTSRLIIEKYLDHGYDCIMDIDVKGGRHLKAIMPDSAAIFLMPPSLPELKRRLFNRATDDPKTIKRRLKNVSRELKFRRFYDYIIVNKDLEKTVNRIKKIIKAH
jgi:guanylate kinase